MERGYSAIQSTKPQTLGYGLNDSPAGLAAWIVEKWRSWSDSSGDVDAHVSRDFLLTVITLYWVTQTITSSMRDYVDNRWSGVPIGPDDFVTVPTAVANFAKIISSPRASRRGSGSSACTTSGSGPRCAAAGISLRPKNPNSSPATSQCSLPTCRMADDRLGVVVTG